MVSATKIADRLPDLPDLPLDLGEVTDRLRGLTDAATETARRVTTTTARPSGFRRMALPLLVLMGLAGLGVGAFLLVRSRRTTADVGPAAPADTYAHT